MKTRSLCAPTRLKTTKKKSSAAQKSHLKRVQNELQELGRVMTGIGDETLKKIGLPEAVYDEIIEYRRMRNFAQRRQLADRQENARHGSGRRT